MGFAFSLALVSLVFLANLADALGAYGGSARDCVRLPSEESAGRLLAADLHEADIVALSPTSVWRVLGQAGL